jgi:hypothetical protein
VSRFDSLSAKNSLESVHRELGEIQEIEILNSIKSVDVAEEMKLQKKKHVEPEEEELEVERTPSTIAIDYDNLQYGFLTRKNLSGGARALIKITLSECKLITDRGVKK